MDDYNLSTLIDSKNEWCARLINILTPHITEGVKSIFNEAYNLCVENDEENKYLMTFQNLLNNIPKWSSEIVSNEKDRITSSSGCNYLEDLLSCVYITQLKALTVTRVGLKQKKINIDIPDITQFVHKIYINLARKIYINVYLFEKDIQPLQIQKHNRELEIIVKECILNTIRDSIPLENILKIYLDETQETDVEIEEHKEIIPDKEAIERQKIEQKEDELRKIREELKKEEKENQKMKIENIINDSIVNKEMKNQQSQNDDEKEDQKEDQKENHLEYDEKDLDKEFTKILNDNVDIEKDIKNLDDDPDKLNLETIEIDTDNLKDDDLIKLDIEEL